MAKAASSPRKTPRKKAVTPVVEDVPAVAAPPTNGAETGPAPKFRIFIIDSGWNSPAGQVLRENFHLIRALERETPIYVLGRERSIEYMRRYPMLVGKDPIIRVHCEAAHKTPGFHGFRLHLGRLKEHDEALQALQNFAKFIGTHRQSSDLEKDMRGRLRQEGLRGAFEIIVNGEAHGVSI